MRTKYKTSFETTLDRISAFKDGAIFYYNRENYVHAAFMLHQVIELTLTAVEVLFLRKKIRTHCIKLHLKYVDKEIPNLKIAFPADTSEEHILLYLLDKAYIAVRYKNLYSIQKEQIDVILNWVEELNQSVVTAYSSVVN